MPEPDPIPAESGQLAHPIQVRFRPRLSSEIIAVAPGVWTLHGLSLANCHVIAAASGLIVVDTGHSSEEGAAILRLIRSIPEIAGRPVSAVLLTHSHYGWGTAAVLADSPPGARIIAHPAVAPAVTTRLTAIGPGQARRIAMESGALLPASGPDAVVAPAPRHAGPSGWLAPTETAGDRPMRLHIDGLTVEVHPGGFDTSDGVWWRFPERQAVAHNLAAGGLPNAGSIAGGAYRDVLPWIAALEAILVDPPDHALPCHGRPRSGRDVVVEHLGGTRDCLRFLYDQVVRGINRGATLHDLVRDLHLPDELGQRADLQPHYGWWPHQIRAVWHGLLGFWSGDPDDLDPLRPEEESHLLAAELGGAGGLAERAVAALSRGEARWAARLAGHALRLGHAPAAATLAAAWRHQAQRMPAWTARNTLLTAARITEGVLDPARLRRPLDRAAATSASTAMLVAALRHRIDPQRASVNHLLLFLHFTDTKETFRLELKHGILHVSSASAEDPALATTTRERWLSGLITGNDLADWPGNAGPLLGCLDPD